MPQLLLELFSEEIPARMQAGAARDLERMAAERLKAAGLGYDSLTTFVGPRRLTLVVEGLPAATPDREEELKGPKVSAPEQALEGFLRKTGLTRDQLTERDGVLFAVISHPGRPTEDILWDCLWPIILDFPWPKSMRWGTGALRWVRPLKRILCLFDGEVIAGSVGGAKTAGGIDFGDLTEGHRFLGSGRPFVVSDFTDYRAKLEAEHVILDAADRKARILERARAVCAERGLELVEDEGLLEEVAGLAEWPTPILGDMDPQFLDLPPEVVRLSMKVHQKYFAVRRPGETALAPHFVVVANVEATDGGRALAAGNSRVLSARLNDARFFWDEDRKPGNFEAWLEKLEGVTFHAKLGTMAERVERIAALAREIAPLVGADPDQAELAARYAKADLASGMVGEFPELQGVMGGYYVQFPSPLAGDGGRSGEADPTTGSPRDPDGGAVSSAAPSDAEPASGSPPIRGAAPPTFPREGGREALADAIRDHYKPQGPNDTVPTAPLTVAVALADKLDTLVGFFAIDEKPTGSKDPYALRRAALGVIRLVLENGVRSHIDQLVVSHFDRLAEQLTFTKVSDDAWAAYQAEKRFGLDPISVVQYESVHGVYVGDQKWFDLRRTVLAFFADRLKVLLRDQGKRHDLVDAVFALGDDDLVRIVRRVEALDGFLTTDDGTNLLAGYKRAVNILRAEAKKGELPTGAVDLSSLTLPAETELAVAVQAARAAVDQALETEDFAAAMRALAGLRAPVDAFFEEVMVNSDVPAERENRLKLLGQVRDVMGRVADFGQIAG